MNITTQRDLIRSVAKRWKDAYCRFGEWDKCPTSNHVAGKGMVHKDKEKIGKALAKLDPEVATAEQVNEIIGNEYWTAMTCDECHGSVTALVDFCEIETASICRNCIAKAAAMEWPNGNSISNGTPRCDFLESTTLDLAAWMALARSLENEAEFYKAAFLDS